MPYVAGYKMQDEKRFEAHLFVNLATAKYSIVQILSHLLVTVDRSLVGVTYIACKNAVDGLDEIFEEDFTIDTPVNIVNVSGVSLMLGDADLMKESNVHLFDQLVTIKYDHTNCTPERCEHNDV